MSWEDDDWDAGVKKVDKPLVAPPQEKNWDDEDKEPETPPAPVVQQQPAQPKPAAKPAGKASAKPKAKPVASAPALSAEEEKRRRADEELKSDFKNAKDIFSGVVDEKDAEIEKKLTTFVPITEADFDEFSRMLNERIAESKSNHNYLKFLKVFMRQLTDTLKAEEVKQLQATLTAIQNERLAAEKAKDGNKGKKKKAAASKRAEDFAEDDFVDDDLDAFM